MSGGGRIIINSVRAFRLTLNARGGRALSWRRNSKGLVKVWYGYEDEKVGILYRLKIFKVGTEV